MFFVGCIKRQKNVLWKGFWSSRICLFYARHKKYRFSVKLLHEPIGYWDVPAIILSFFYISNVLKLQFKNREHILLTTGYQNIATKTDTVPRQFHLFVNHLAPTTLQRRGGGSISASRWRVHCFPSPPIAVLASLGGGEPGSRLCMFLVLFFLGVQVSSFGVMVERMLMVLVGIMVS